MNPIDEAAAYLSLARMQSKRAKEAEDAAFATLVALLPRQDEGTVNMQGESYKVAIEYGMNRTVDAAALAAIKDRVPVALFEQAITYKPSIVLAGLRYLQSNEPETYAVLAQAITAKPAKPSVRVEAIAVDLQGERNEVSDEVAHLNQLRMREISGIRQQQIIAHSGRLGVRVGGTIECIKETLAETELWSVSEENFGPLTGLAQATKDHVIERIREMLTAAQLQKAA